MGTKHNGRVRTKTIERKIDEQENKFGDHIDIEVMEMMTSGQCKELPKDFLNAAFNHIKFCLVCSEQFHELENGNGDENDRNEEM